MDMNAIADARREQALRELLSNLASMVAAGKMSAEEANLSAEEAYRRLSNACRPARTREDAPVDPNLIAAGDHMGHHWAATRMPRKKYPDGYESPGYVLLQILGRDLTGDIRIYAADAEKFAAFFRAVIAELDGPKRWMTAG